MTDESKEVLSAPEEDQATLEPADTLAEEQVSEPDVSDDTGEPVPETAEPAGEGQEAVPQADQPVGEEETTGDEMGAPVPESELPEGTDVPLTQGERDIDRVIGVLLGEPQEAEPQEDREQATEDGEQEASAPDNPSADLGPPSSEPEPAPTVESVLEAILFATDEPLTDGKLASIVETTVKQVRTSIENLNARYTAENHAFRIEQIAGGYQMLTLNTYNPWLKKMLRVRSDSKLSPAAMETLAIIAYKQPIIRADIEAIRGVAVGDGLRNLMYKGLVKITGRAEILGRPMLYGTTRKFLEVFGLNTLKDLPKVEELKNPDRG